MWQKIVLWIILAVCGLHIASWPYMQGVLGRQRYGTGDVSKDFSDRIHQWESLDTIRLNVSWICLTIAVVGLGVVKRDKP